MRIKTVISLGCACAVVGALAAGTGLHRSSDNVDRALGVDRTAGEIVRSVLNLNVLAVDYLLYPLGRSRVDWQTQHESLGRRLDRADVVSSPWREELDGIRRDHARSKQIFDRLAAGVASAPSAEPSGLDRVRTEDQSKLATQLLIASRAMSTAAHSLGDRSRSEVDRALTESRATVAVLLATFVVLALVASVFLVRRITRPIECLRGNLEILGQGNLGHRIGSSSKDEFGSIAASVDAMAEKLQGTTVSRDKLTEEVTALARAQAKLADMTQMLQSRTTELEAVNRELEAFSYSVSHDLRAPLRTIAGFSRSLVEDHAADLDETAKDYVDRIQAGCARMAALIDDLLKLSRVGRGKLEIRDVDLSEMAAGIAQKLQERSPDRGIDFDIEPGLTVRCDERLLRVVLNNLFENAWKFTAHKLQGMVTLSSSSEGGTTIYHIRDNGAGFDMAHADKLFQPFQRLHRQAEFPGSGIGLATVARVFHRHGGQVWVESEIDRGTTVHFTI